MTTTPFTPGPAGPDPDHGGPARDLVPVPRRRSESEGAAEDRSDVSFEVVLDDPPTQAPQPVDSGGDGEIVLLDDPDEGEYYPVIPQHLRSLGGIGDAVARHAHRLAHRVGFHGLRAPRYLLLALLWAGVGLVRLVGRQLAWWWVAEQAWLRSQVVAAGDSREWLRLHREVKDTRRFRGLLLAAELVAVTAAVTVLILRHLMPGWAWLVVAAVAVPALARVGRPADRPIIAAATTVPRFRVLNADVVLRAYYAAGLGHPDKPGRQVEFETIMSRNGAGSQVGVILPYDTTNDTAVKARPGIAAGLDVALSQVYLTPSRVSHRRHTLWIADTDPLAVPVGRTPLLACRPTDIWAPAPLGLDERGRLVELGLMWVSVLVGALPRQGKTFVARLLGLYAALDPYVRLDVFDTSGKPDWRRFALVADSYAFGLTPTRDGLPAELFLATLERIKAEVQDRYHRLSQLPPAICPEGKLTRRIARDPDLGMPVRGIFLDEFQEWFELGEISKEIAALLVYLSKVAPAAGVFLVDATQRPSGIGGGGTLGQLFTAFRDNHAVRFSLRTASYTVSETVLGQGAYGEGLDSSTLLPEYKGVGILRGATDHSPTTRVHLADADDAAKILTAARELRIRAGTLSGMAAGLDLREPAADILADAAAVFAGDHGLHWELLAQRLATRFPQRHADATAESVSAACRARGVPSVDIRYPPGRAGANKKGCRRADLDRAAAHPPPTGLRDVPRGRGTH